MASKGAPAVIIISGPNGAGKSTIAPRVLRGALSVPEFVNADVIARGLSAFEPEKAAVSAGRIMLQRLRELAEMRADFAFETTLASRSFAPGIKSLIETGYRFYLVYIWVPTPELSIQRVASRVELGGHNVEPDVIRRRYSGGLRNFFELYRPLAKRWRCYNNAEQELKLIASGQGARNERGSDRPIWENVRQTYATARQAKEGH